MQRGYTNISKRVNDLLATSQSKSYFVAAVTTVLVIIMAVVGIVPAYSAFTFQSKENEIRQSYIERLQAKLDDSKELSQQLEANKDVVDYFNFVLPDKLSQDNVIEILNKISQEAQVSFNNLSFSKNTSSNKKKALPANTEAQSINWGLKGPRANLVNALKLIELSRRIFNIESFSIGEELNSDGSPSGNYILSLSMQYFFIVSSNE